MHNTDSPKFIQLPITEINSSDLIRQLSDDNHQLSDNIFQLRQVIDEMANTLAMQKELIQQLRDEIARLKGQKPKPDIKPSKLEGQNRKPDWHKRIGLHDGQRRTVLFSLWVYIESLERLSLHVAVSAMATAATTLQMRSLDISQLARRVIKKVRRIGKPGQPKGKPRGKKPLLQIHETPVIQPINIPEGAVFKGFKRYTVQDIVFEPHNTQYQLARWQLPD